MNPERQFDAAQRVFQQGYLTESQRQADRGYRQFLHSDPAWASRFQLLEAEALQSRGMNEDALSILRFRSTTLQDQPETAIKRLTVEALAHTRLQQFAEASQLLHDADSLCAQRHSPVCGDAVRAKGLLALEEGKFAEAHELFLKSLQTARENSDLELETTSLLNLGVAMFQQERFDEALDWSTSAYRAANLLGNKNLQQFALGNLGWAYFRLGDIERSLGLFIEAQEQAKEVGNVRTQIIWLSTAGNAYRDSGDLARTEQSYRAALDLARQIDSKPDVINSLEDLAHVAIDSGKLDDATAYVKELTPLVSATDNRLDDLDVLLAEGRIAAARHQDVKARAIFTTVEKDPDSQTSMRLGAEHEQARLYESENDVANAGGMYRTALATFESARDELKEEASKLPFLANATPIYDDYIHFLVEHGKPGEALAAADQSRARTLAQGLGQSSGKAFRPAPLRPQEVARKANATLLFYWLGERQSYLWAITPNKTAVFPLPAQGRIVPVAERYRKAILGPVDPVQAGNEDGRALYQMLVAPAAAQIPADSPVMILTDGALSRLNFETLLAPGDSPLKAIEDPDPPSHYWIDDVRLSSAPSLSMLMAAKPAPHGDKKLLLLGDAVSADQDYPELPHASLEMREIARHFAPGEASVYSRQKARPSAYLASNPARYSYIHFVTHGVASRTDPLDSAIILSRDGKGDDSFKLHAREIIRHPINARLVTISACYGSGERSYAGEGLVGLSWAFLRAGAHNVIGALWEASDESTPLLMDKLYDGLESGAAPDDALRRAKLALLHSKGKFHSPFFWASFQITTGQ